MSDAWTRRKLTLYAATLVVLGAVFLRVDTLGARPLWADERAVDSFVSEAERDGLGAAAAPRASGQLTEAHLAPLHVMLAYASAQALGRSSIALRLPSVLASVATVLLVIALGTTLFDHRVGLVAGALVAISPYQIEYAQNARSYALFVALASAQLLAWFRFAATHHMGWLVAFTLTGAASAYAHHLGLLNQAAFGVLALANAAGDRLATRSPASHRALGRRELLLLAGAFTAMGLLYLPQLGSFLGFLDSGVAEPHERLAPSARFAHALAGLWGGGRGAPALLYEALFLIGIVAGIRAQRPAPALVWWIACPILVFSLVPFSKFFDARYLMAAQPAFLLLVAAGAVAVVDVLRARRVALVATAALAIAFAWPAAGGYLEFRKLPLRCGEFFLEPRILDLAGGFCRRYVVLNTLVPEERYLLRAVAPDFARSR